MAAVLTERDLDAEKQTGSAGHASREAEMTGCHVPNTCLRKLKWGARPHRESDFKTHSDLGLPASKSGSGDWRPPGQARILMGANGQAGFFLWA